MFIFVFISVFPSFELPKGEETWGGGWRGATLSLSLSVLRMRLLNHCPAPGFTPSFSLGLCFPAAAALLEK